MSAHALKFPGIYRILLCNLLHTLKKGVVNSTISYALKSIEVELTAETGAERSFS